ncbi:MAG: recombinase RecT [Synergistales bacterium]|nr:recombinase RecT [Synergistales bacterium]
MSHLTIELERVKPRLVAIAPPGYNVDQVIASVLWVVERDEDLSRCSTRSIVEAVIEAVAMGLDPSGLTGQGTLIPRKMKGGGMRATFVPDYRALLRLALSHPRVSHIEARVVREGDEFGLSYGDPEGRVIYHRPRIGAQGEPLGAYAVVWFRDSFRPLVEWMTKEEIEANAERGGSYGNENSPWETDWGEMARKTVIKRLLKYLPLGNSAQPGERLGEVAGIEVTPASSPGNSPAVERAGRLDYREAIAEADSEQIDLIIRTIREDDTLDHHEKTELFNLAVSRKKELKGARHAGAVTTER